MRDGTFIGMIRFPYPWPPVNQCLICEAEVNGQTLELFGLAGGTVKIVVTSLDKQTTESSTWQPLDMQSNVPRWATVSITLQAVGPAIRVAGQELLRDSPGIPTLQLPPQTLPTVEISMNDPNAKSACQQWINNRRSKFNNPRGPRPHRRAKTVEEEASDLRNSVLRLNHLREQVQRGELYLLGTLAGEMRASVYWPKGRDAQWDDNWNPLLLRMASKADLPLPVYFLPPVTPLPSGIAVADLHLQAIAARTHRKFQTDKICDLQDLLLGTALRIGPSPSGKEIIALYLIKELAHTMGASHYDSDASEFLDVMHTVKTAAGDQVATFMCQSAEALVSLSDWVLSELKNRKLIA